MNRTSRRVLSTAILTFAMTAGPAAVFAPIAPAQAADKGPSVRPEVGKPVQAAQELIKQKKFKEALSELSAADAVSGKSAYESYAIAATRESVYAQSGDYANTVKASEALIASGQLQPADIVNQYSIQAKLNNELANYPGVITAANKYYANGGTDPIYRQLIAQAYYKQGDFPHAASTLRSMMTGGKPTEDQLTMLMGIEYKSNPAGPGYVDALEKLVQYYPKKNYWHDLILSVQKKPGFSEKLRPDVDQIKIATGVMDNPDDFMNAAESAIQGGFPGEAKVILDKGFAAGVLGQGPEAARQKRLQDLATNQSASDVKSLSLNAAQAKGGSELTKLGDSYASYGQLDNAVAAYQKAIAAGDANLAKLHLGIAYLNAGQKPKAKEALKSVTGADGTQDLAALWMLEGGI